MNNWGNKLRLSIFGESHGTAIGIVIDGLPPGVAVDTNKIEIEMSRRAPGTSEYTTERAEADTPEIISGIKDRKTTGAPLCGVIKNSDTRSSDYTGILRPGQADWPAMMKFNGYSDFRGNGHFSGRITAPIVFAGAIAKQILTTNGVGVYARIKSISDITDDIDITGISPVDTAEVQRAMKEVKAISAKDFPASDGIEPVIKTAILDARRDGDSLGGVIEVIAIGVNPGLGEPFFQSFESRLASILFSVPAVKGVEFGKGFAITTLRGSKANDPLRLHEGSVYSTRNNNGGILGGITTGMPIIARTAIKPTASVRVEQDTVDPRTMEEVRIGGRGRHDPCIVPRAVPVVESCMALTVLDLMLEQGGWDAVLTDQK
jgi:chorismate synthase